MALLETHAEHIPTDRDHRHKGGVGTFLLAAVALAAAGGGGAYATNFGGFRERFETRFAQSDEAVAGGRNASAEAPIQPREVAPIEPQHVAPPVSNDPYAGYRMPGPANLIDMGKIANCASARNQQSRGRWRDYGCPGEMPSR